MDQFPGGVQSSEMLAKTDPKNPDKSRKDRHPKPGHLLNPTQCEQTEVKTNDTCGKMPHRRLAQPGVDRLCRCHQLPSKPNERDNQEPARRRDMRSGAGCPGH